MEVVKSHGCICLTGLFVERTAADALAYLEQAHGREPAPPQIELLGSPSSAELDSCPAVFRPHVTLVTKEELAACSTARSDLLHEFQRLDPINFFAAGIAIADIPDMSQLTIAASSCSSQQKQITSSMSTVSGQGSRVPPRSTHREAQSPAHVDPETG